MKINKKDVESAECTYRAVGVWKTEKPKKRQDREINKKETVLRGVKSEQKQIRKQRKKLRQRQKREKYTYREVEAWKRGKSRRKTNSIRILVLYWFLLINNNFDYKQTKRKQKKNV